ncbi:single-stranded DNA-binding protein [Actinacidiphila glaucinigra]|uniref:single-stranded DNA-binding protein n=1 Tax=Actinacidiphila glaucinigra TaxID=235986 RepID=UPI0035E335AA
MRRAGTRPGKGTQAHHRARARFTVVSTPRSFDRETNTWRDGEPAFLDCSAWQQLAENLAQSVTKGARVVVAGRLRTDRWETSEGEKRSRMVLDVGASMTFATVASPAPTDPPPHPGKPHPTAQGPPPAPSSSRSH